MSTSTAYPMVQLPSAIIIVAQAVILRI